jgi:predicted nucleotidyltransferase
MPKKIDSTILEQLLSDLRKAHGDNLASVVLYGSAAAGDQIELRSDHNLLIALNRITSEDLRLAQAAMRKWQDLGQPVPVYFTVAELQDAADVFPIEFLQMEKARKVLYGRDPFEVVKISRANLRHQTEYELRTKLIRLRRLFIPASVSVEKLSALMSDSLASFASLFRAVLILMGQEPPIAKADSLRATAKLLDLDAAPFERILEMRTGKERPQTAPDADSLFSAYMEQIERVINAVDRIEGE